MSPDETKTVTLGDRKVGGVLPPIAVAIVCAMSPVETAFIAALLATLDASCQVVVSDCSVDGAPFGTELVLYTGDSEQQRQLCPLRMHIGPVKEADTPAASNLIEITDPSNPDAARQATLALRQFPEFDPIRWFGTASPSVRVVEAAAFPDTETIFHELYGESSHCVWLDSSNAHAVTASRSRFSIMADDAGATGQKATHLNGVTTVESPVLSYRVTGKFFDWLERNWDQDQETVAGTPEGAEFSLGWLGFLGYELKRECGGSDVMSALPDAALIRCSRALLFDHQEQALYLLAEGDESADLWISDTLRRLSGLTGSQSKAESLGRTITFESNDSDSTYLAKVHSAQHEIAEGNSYEVCLTTQLTSEAIERLDPWTVYRHLRRVSPAPFASFVRMGSLTLASSSPERFLRLDTAGCVRAEPIKGTRGRGKGPVEDLELRRELLLSEKDRAENIMIVDLLRNDLSRHALPGSVTVSRLCSIETYSNVHQLVSSVDARLAACTPRARVVAAAYPPGSMTGAPKISSMAILDRLEPRTRGPYAGVVGYFSPSGAADLSVTIRCLVFDDRSPSIQRVMLGVGGAITADSSAADELAEIRIKASSILGLFGSPFPL